MALGLVVAADIANAVLIDYTRGDTLAQTTQDKPLLRFLDENAKTFPSGNLQLSDPVQGTFMSDTAGFLQGYQEDDALTFNQAQNILRTYFPWKETAVNLIISFTELKKDGITVKDHSKTSEHDGVEATRLVGLMKNRMADFMESKQRVLNTMFWGDGTVDPKWVPGLRSILTDTPTAGTTGGLNRATYQWWQHRTLIGDNRITPSAENQTLSKRLRAELRQLRRYGGRPDKALAGSRFIEALELEVQAKGIYTQEGFKNAGKTDLGMAQINMMGLGTFEYDPSLDDQGITTRCYIVDSRRIKRRPMAEEKDKVSIPERPYQYMVYLYTITNTDALVATQLNCNGIYEVSDTF